MAKTGIKSNIPKAMREFDKSLQKLYSDVQNREASLATLAMNRIREDGLIKGEFDKDNKRSYEDIKVSDAGIIVQKAKSQKGKTRALDRYKYKGTMRKRKNKYAERDRGEPRIKKVFHKSKIAVRTGDFFRIFERTTRWNTINGKLIQPRQKAKITIDQMGNKDGKRSIQFDFFGTEGRALRLLSFGQKRVQPLNVDGVEIKGRKGKRDVVAKNIRKTFRQHNKMIQKYIDTDYARMFKRIA